MGSATAVSPLYPKPLTAKAYLTGTALGPDLTLVFPAPFPLTLTGSVTLTTKDAVFTGLPDIPLTSLKLVLNGGPKGLFLTNCNPGAGVADASSTDQNGDKSVSASVNYSIAGCAAVNQHELEQGESQRPTERHHADARRCEVRSPVAELQGQRPQEGRQAHPAHGEALARDELHRAHRVGKRMKVTGVSVSGAKIKSLAISHGRLVIKLRKAVASFRVKLTSVLHEDDALIADAAKGKKVQPAPDTDDAQHAPQEPHDQEDASRSKSCTQDLLLASNRRAGIPPARRLIEQSIRAAV